MTPIGLENTWHGVPVTTRTINFSFQLSPFFLGRSTHARPFFFWLTDLFYAVSPTWCASPIFFVVVEIFEGFRLENIEGLS